jgi:hypothetical protein
MNFYRMPQHELPIQVFHCVTSASIIRVDFDFVLNWVGASKSNITGLPLAISLAPKIDVHIPENGTSYADRIVKELKRVCKQYSTKNWDGYGAQPISQQACDDAERFVQMLPPSVKPPEITPVPDGDIALEWYGKENTVFFVTFRGDNMMEYIGSFGEGKKTTGLESLDEGISGILRYIDRINLTGC